jgi:hypothetical protein
VEDSRVPGCGSTCCAYDGGGKAVGAFIIIGGAAFWARIGMFEYLGLSSRPAVHTPRVSARSHVQGVGKGGGEGAG